jgi:predicted lactoylglutathione lyase
LAWTAESRDDVDRLHKRLLEIGAANLDPPADYPRYGEGYYAVFFADPDGMKLEVVHMPWGYWKRAMTDGTDPRPRG